MDRTLVMLMHCGARKEYNIPKSEVDGFNGAEVFLKLSIAELEKFKVH